MKTKIVFYMFLMTLATGAGAERARLAPNSVVQVAADHSSVQARVSNRQAEDIFCDSIELDVVRTGSDFNDFASRIQMHSGPIYIAKGKAIDLSSLGSTSELSAQGVVSVANATLQTESCHAADFAEYCEYAEKTAEEQHTTNHILREARRECAEAEAAIGNSLTIYNQNIRELKPIGFLRKLMWLDVSNNMIEDLSPLNNLSLLRSLNVSSNNVDDLTPVLKLVSIRKVMANHTLVDSKIDPIKELHRRKVSIELYDTPYSRKKK